MSGNPLQQINKSNQCGATQTEAQEGFFVLCKKAGGDSVAVFPSLMDVRLFALWLLLGLSPGAAGKCTLSP